MTDPIALAQLRHLYQNMVNGAVRDTASAKRMAEGLLALAIEVLERGDFKEQTMTEPTDAELDAVLCKHWPALMQATLVRMWVRAAMRAAIVKWGTPPAEQAAPKAAPAPQQEAQEPVAWLNPWRADQVTTDYDAYGERGIPLYTAPQPAPLSDREAFETAWEKRHAPVPINGRTHDDGRYGDSSIQDAWESWQAHAALAAQGGSK